MTITQSTSHDQQRYATHQGRSGNADHRSPGRRGWTLAISTTPLGLISSGHSPSILCFSSAIRILRQSRTKH